MKTFGKILGIVFCLLYLPNAAFAGWGIVDDQSFSATLDADKFNGTNFFIIQDNLFDENAPSPLKSYVSYESAKATLVLGVDKNFTNYFESTVYDVHVNLKIDRWDAAGAMTTEYKTLDVTYDPERNRTENFEHIYSIEGYHKIKVQVQSITGSGYSGPFPLNLTLRGLMQVERYYDLSTIDPLIGAANTVTDAKLPVTWSVPTMATGGDPLEPEFYEVEWTFSEIGEENGSSNLEYAFDFFRNSSRIQVKDNSYSIPFVYPQGLLVWRVRAVGYDPGNDKYVYGDWNFVESGTGVENGSDYDLVGGSGAEENLVYSDGFHLDENWSYEVSFIENGKYGQSIGYHDGLLYNRMAISRPNDGEAMVSKTIYDFHRRPAIELLPTPVPSTLEYQDNFAIASNTANDGYSWEHFDLDDNGVCVETKTYSMDGSSGPSNYYSNLNTFTQVNGDYLPNADGYPFAQTEYTPDNTGRVRRKGGVGPEHRLTGLDEYNNPMVSHESKFYYSRPLQQQLDRLFGNSVGHAEHYQKNTVIDPNGQISISYIDPQGRIIATALAGDPANASMMDDLTAPVIEFETNEVIENSSIDYFENSLVAKLDHTVHTAAVYSIAYSIDIPQLNPSCPVDFCVDCIYDLEISLVDECGVEYIVVDPLNAASSNIALYQNGLRIEEGFNIPVDETCAGPYTLVLQPTDAQAGSQTGTDHLEVFLPVGKYTLQKKLTVNKAALDYYAETYEEQFKANCLPSLQTYIDEEKAKFDYGRCFTTCEDCQSIVDPEEKQFCLDQCALLNDPCLLLRMQIKADMSPGGQYFDNQAAYDPEVGGIPFDPSIQNDWLNSSLGADLNTNNIPDFLETFNTKWNTSYESWDELKANWNDDYLEDFISKHPEHCKLTECDAVASLKNFELQMLAIEDGQTAESGGYFNPAVNNASALDPVFQTGGLLAGSISSAQAEVLKILNEIDYKRLHDGATNQTGSPIDGCRSDFEWAFFRARYLSWRKTQIDNASTTCSTSIPSGKIQRFYQDAEEAFAGKGYDINDPNFKDDFSSDFNTELTNGCSTTVNMQMEQLIGCGFSPSHAALLADEFTFICENSVGQVGSPYGSSYTMTPTSHGNYSLAQALDWAIITFNYNYSSVCNELLLEVGINEKSGMPGTAELDECVCEKIADNNTLFDLGNLPTGICSKEELFEYTYGEDPGDLQMLECICQRKADPNFNSSVCSQYFGDYENYGDASMIGDYQNLEPNFIFQNSKSCIGVGGKYLDPKATMLISFLRKLDENGQLLSTTPFYLNQDYAEFIGPGKLFDAACSLFYSISNDPGITLSTEYIVIDGVACGFNCTMTVYFLESGTPPEASSFELNSYNLGTTKVFMSLAGVGPNFRVEYDCEDFGCTNPNAINLPTVFVPVSLTCNKCIDCEEIQSYYETFAAAHPYALDPSQNNNTLELFWKYLRVKEGKYYAIENVKTFLTQCFELTSQSCTTNQVASDFHDWIEDMIGNGDFGSPETFLNSNYLTSYVNNPNLYTKGSGCNPVLRNSGGLYWNPGGSGLPGLYTTEWFGPGLHLTGTFPSSIGEGYSFLSGFTFIASGHFDAGTLITIDNQSNEYLEGGGTQLTLTLPELNAGDTFNFGGLLSGFEGLTVGTASFGLNISNAGGLIYSGGFNLNLGTPGDYVNFNTSNEHEFILSDDCGTKCTFKFILPDAEMNLANITGIVPGSMEPDEGGIITGNSFKVMVTIAGYPDPVEMIVYSSCHNFFDCDDFINNDGMICPAEYTMASSNPCSIEYDRIAEINALMRYTRDVREAIIAFRTEYITTCMAPVENFALSFMEKEFHHTLYYYDRAGNLLRTVPPQNYESGFEPYLSGTALTNVDLYRNGNGGAVEYPDYTHYTDYVYNTLGEVVTQETPDGGITNFWYDYLGRIALSQNAKQIQNDEYSYTRLDELGRIFEVGQRIINVSPAFTTDDIGTPNTLDVLLTNSEPSRTQITKSYYDETLAGVSIPGFTAINTQYRIASVATYPDVNSPYASAIHYSYDALGNVETQITDNPSLASFGGQFKRLDYVFDLASGNVNYVFYQKGEIDRWSHFYRYDYKNRLEEVYTSRIFDASILSDGYYVDRANSPEWTKEINYDYYLHGPLARTETGQFKVQGSDYFYTIHGWLKGVNDEFMKPQNDLGQDGYVVTTQALSANPNRLVAQDVYAFNLGYYTNDYSQVKGVTNPIATATGSTYGNSWNNKDLFNGNIRNMTTTIPSASVLTNSGDIEASPRGATFHYDLLNRIKASFNFMDDNITTHMWGSSVSTGAYNTTYTYDARGNIMTLDRNGDQAPLEMDRFEYNYKTNTNQLIYVEDDPAISGNYSDDIDKHQSTLNFEYDDIGNLTRDLAENIVGIDWNLQGKIASITFSGGTKNNLEFAYDPMGRRISKKEIYMDGSGSLTSYYAYDATGNLLAVYEVAEVLDGNQNLSTVTYLVNEFEIYGSARVGMLKAQQNISEIVKTLGDPDPGTPSTVFTEPNYSDYVAVLGKHRYEFSNHLGNVLAVLTDRPISIKEAGSSTAVNHFEADVANLYDYYPFGMHMKARVYSEQSCSTVTTYTPVPLPFSFSNWKNIGTGSVQSNGPGWDIVNGGMPGDGGAIKVQASPALDPLIVDLNNLDVSTLDPSNTVEIRVKDPNGLYVSFKDNMGTSYSMMSFPAMGGMPPSLSIHIDPLLVGTYEVEIVMVNADPGAMISMPSSPALTEMQASSQLVCESLDYRFGFQGQEKDDEINGSGNSISYKYRMHDTRLGRFLSIDPLNGIFPWNSPYAFSENRVIDGLELEGLEVVYFGNTKVEVDITLMTDDEVEKLFEQNKVNFDSDWLTGRTSTEYWKVQAYNDNWGNSTGTKILKYGLKESAMLEHPNAFFTEWDRSFLEYMAAHGQQFERHDGWKDGATFFLAFAGTVLSGGTLATAEGTLAVAYAATVFVISADDLTESPEGQTFLESTIGSAFGEDYEKLYKGAKFAVNIRDATKGLADVTILLADGKKITGTYDFFNAVFSVAGAVDDVNQKVEEQKVEQQKAKEK